MDGFSSRSVRISAAGMSVNISLTVTLESVQNWSQNASSPASNACNISHNSLSTSNNNNGQTNDLNNEQQLQNSPFSWSSVEPQLFWRQVLYRHCPLFQNWFLLGSQIYRELWVLLQQCSESAHSKPQFVRHYHMHAHGGSRTCPDKFRMWIFMLSVKVAPYCFLKSWENANFRIQTQKVPIDISEKNET